MAMLNLRLRTALLVVVNLLLVALMVQSASLIHRPPLKSGAPLPDDSIVYDGRLLSWEYSIEDGEVRVETSGEASVYLVRTATEVLSGARVDFEVPALGLRGSLSESSPGVYTIERSEAATLTFEAGALDVDQWTAELDDWSLNGKHVVRLSFADYLEQAGIRAAGEPQTYEIPLTLTLAGRLRDHSGAAVANTAIRLSLPAYGYDETIVTDPQGRVQYERTETVRLSVSGGTFVTLTEPLTVPGVSPLDVVAFWPGEGGGGGNEPGLCLSVSSATSHWLVGEIVSIHGKVTDCNDGPIEGADVKITVKRPDGSVAQQKTVKTGASGWYRIMFKSTPPIGEYQVEVEATHDGETATETTTYVVKAGIDVYLRLSDQYTGAGGFGSRGYYHVYRRGKDDVTATVYVDPREPFDDDVWFNVEIALFRADKYGNTASFVPVASYETYISVLDEEVVVEDAVVRLRSSLPIGYYRVRATVSGIGGNGSLGDAMVRDLGVIFSAPWLYDYPFVRPRWVPFRMDSPTNWYVYNLSHRSGLVFNLAMDAADGTTDEATAAGELMDAVQHVVDWDKSYPLVLFSAWPGLFFFCHDLDELTPANEDCVYGGHGHTAHYAGYMTALLRAVGIPAYMETGGVGSVRIGALDVDERADPLPLQELGSHFPGHPAYEWEYLNTRCLRYHIWSRAYVAGDWMVFDANHDVADTFWSYWNNQVVNRCTEWLYFQDTGCNLYDVYCNQPDCVPSSPTGLDGGFPSPTVGAERYGFKDNEDTLTIWLAPPVVHFGQDVSVMVEVTNRTEQPWTGDLLVWLTGTPIEGPLASDYGAPETVWETSEPLSLEPGQRSMPTFTIAAAAYADLGFGEYFVRVDALGERTAGRLYLTGAPEVEIQAPAQVALDEPVEVKAVVRNPTEADVHDVWIRPMNPAMDEQFLGTLTAGAETAVSWTFTPEEPGKETVGVLVETAGAGATEAAGIVHVLAPPELEITVDAPERVEIGEDFEIVAEVLNPGDGPVVDVTAVLAGYPAELVLLADPEEVELGELDAGAMTEVRWQATALAPGRASARVEAAAGELDARCATTTIIAEPGHGVDLVIEDVGRDVVGGLFVAEAPIGAGTNFVSAGYDVEVVNTGSVVDTVVVSVFPGDGDCVAAFGDEEDEEEEDAWSRRELTLGAGETVLLSLTLRTLGEESTARVVVRSLGDGTQWDQMAVVVRYTDATSLQVEPDQVALTIAHGASTTSVIEVSNTGGTPLTNVELSPRGNIAGWITLERTTIAELAPDETVPVTITVAVPRYQAPGDYGGAVRVESGSQSDAVAVNVQVPEHHAVVLTLTPLSRAVVPGNTGVFVLGVKNEGNVSDGYDLAVDGLPDGWEVSWSRNPALVEPGARADVDLLIIPLRAHWTAPDWYGFTVTAANDDADDEIDGEIEALVFHDVDLAIDGADVVPAPPIIVDKVWKKAHEHPHGHLAVIIKTHGAPSEFALAALEGHGVRVKRRFKVVDAIAAEIPAARLTEIAAEPFVARIELDEEVTAFADVGALGVDGLYADGYDGTGVVVAVVDTGVDLDHPALPNLAAGYDFVNDDADPDDDHGHGTHVAGIVGAQDAEYPGVAPGVVILPVKVLGADGTGMSSDVIAGIEWSVENGADVVNLSLGSSGGDGTSALSEAADNAVRSGVVVVAAVGNSGPDFETVASPADAKLVVGVGALETTTAVADFSSRGPTLDGRVKPDVVAPGVNIVSTWSDGGFHALSGTSMAAPHVAGVVALLLHAHPEATPELVREALASSAVRLDGFGSNTQGAGRVYGDGAAVDLGQALTVVSSTTAPGDTAEYAFTLTNLGNVVDGFDLDVDAQELPSTVLVYPKAIGESWTTLPFTPVGLNPGEQTADVAEIAVPDDWAGMESVTYRFMLTTTSTGEPEVGDAERGALGVEATKRSKIEYARLEILALYEDIGRASKPRPLRAKLDAALDKVDKAISELVSGDLIGTNTSLDAAVNKMEAFVNEVEAQRRSGKLDASLAESFLVQAEAVIVHLVGARRTEVE